MCYPMPAVLALQQAIPNSCPAKLLPPSQRLQIGLQALAGAQSVTDLADEFDVSRKFVHRQADILDQAAANAFDSKQPDDEVLFHLPVTKAWLRQLMLGQVLICHSPLRGVVELLCDLFAYDISLGTVFNTVHAAITPARQRNQAQDLSRVPVGGHDEIFQAGQPVLMEELEGGVQHGYRVALQVDIRQGGCLLGPIQRGDRVTKPPQVEAHHFE